MTETTTAAPPVEEDLDGFEFSQGMEGAAEEAKASRKAFARREWEWFDLKDGQAEIIRCLNDAFYDEDYPHIQPYISIVQHSSVPTRPKPDGYTGNWPARMSAVCRHAKAFKDRFGDCFICDYMKNPDVKSKGKYEPYPRGYMLACRREEVFGDGTEATGGPKNKGKLLGIRDKLREVPKIGPDGKEIDGEVELIKDICLINLGRKNFFGILEGFAGRYHTLLDRDYHITREGAGASDTTYKIAPIDRIEMGIKEVNGEQTMTYYDVRNPEIWERYQPVPDIRRVVVGFANDEYFGRFFDTRVSNERTSDSTNSTPGAATPATPAGPSGDVEDEARMAELRARIRGPQGEAAPSAAAPAASTEEHSGLAAL